MKKNDLFINSHITLKRWLHMNSQENNMEDPRIRFSTLLKNIILMIMSCSAALSLFAVDVYYPSIPEIEVELNASQIQTTLALVFYLLFMGIFPIFMGALSDFYETRRYIIIPSIILFTLSSIGIAFIKDIMGLIVLRCFQAIGAGSSMVLGPAMIADLYPIEKRGKAYGKFVFGLIMGPTIAPTIGGFLAMSDISWRASFWFCAGLGGLLTILIILCIPETYRKHSKFDIILSVTPIEKCYHDKDMNSSNDSIDNEQNKNNYLKQGQQNEDITEKKFNPMLPLFLLRYPHVLLSSLACAIAFGVQISTDVILPNLFKEKYGFNALEIGLAYLSGGIGNISSAILHGIISDKLLLKSRSKRAGGKHKIEDRFTFNLWPSCMILIPLGSLLFGWSVKNGLNYWIPMVGYFISCFGTTQVLAIVSTYLTDSIPDHAASVAAGTVFVRETITCLLSLLSVKLLDSIGPGYLTIVLSGLIWVSFGFLIILKIYGQRFRHHSGLKQMEE